MTKKILMTTAEIFLIDINKDDEEEYLHDCAHTFAHSCTFHTQQEKARDDGTSYELLTIFQADNK